MDIYTCTNNSNADFRYPTYVSSVSITYINGMYSTNSLIHISYQPALDVYIYFVQNYQNILIKKISDINTSKGSVAVLVDDSWRVDPSAQTYESLIYIVPNGINPEKELANRYSDYPPPIHNLVERKSTSSSSSST